MRAFWLASALSLAAVAVPCASVAAPAPRVEIRVRLHRELPAVDVSGYGLRITAPSALVDVEFVKGLERARITRPRANLWLVQWRDGRKTQRIEAERLSVRGQLLRVDLQPAPYEVEILKNRHRGLDVVARLDLDKYLMGVLPSEMPASWPIEALKAQAVAARSFVLRQAFDHHARDFDVDSTVMDQVYKFLDDSAEHPDWVERVSRAVDTTRGEVLFDAGKRVLKAFYSADCGCQSEDPKFVWGKLDAFESVKDPSCQSRKATEWSLNLGRHEVREKLIAALDLPDDTDMRTVQVGGRTPSGRVAKVVAAMGVSGKTRKLSLSSQEFRRIFGFQRVQSADFKMRWLADELEIVGTGSGHGVGLCQLGARGLAEKGMGYREILKTYYPRANLRYPPWRAL